MKHLALLLSLIFFAIAAPAAIPYEWSADVDRPVPAVFEPFEGETVELACRVVRNRRDFPLFATNATCYCQTNGMGRYFWSVPATVDGSLLRATLTPSDVPVGAVVRVLLGASGPSGIVYRANAILRYLPSPGATPNVLPLPTPRLDFSTVAVTNAPWALASDLGSLASDLDGKADRIDRRGSISVEQSYAWRFNNVPANWSRYDLFVEYVGIEEWALFGMDDQQGAIQLDMTLIDQPPSSVERIEFWQSGVVAERYTKFTTNYTSRVVYLDDLVAATNALYQLLNH